ncbi:perlucin-like protein [Magallana gigas]|uniref:perlucin-like protein n=1 Tax=Magallana gigas TaxID=29159 RepID=UPI00148A1997|nr:perlucin-like protein [Crassostrea gigas]
MEQTVLVCGLLMLVIVGVIANIDGIYSTETAIKCENGWVPFQKNCYYYSRNSKTTFKDAVLNCINLGGSLVEIRSKWEEKWIALHIRVREYDDGVWLGFNDLQNEGQFIAMSDAKEPLYTNWGSTEPNNGLHKDEHCVMYWPKYKCWNDSNCTSRLNYVCKTSPK